tara:strand:+ start:24274 stop:25020 length:747 start_codon:yes stop_codon:yes gene_type:complete
MNKLSHFIKLPKRKINRLLNRKSINNKVFCIGLHKTGTTTLGKVAEKYGFKSTHSTDWNTDENQLNAFEFFSDGGSHFDRQHEFNYEQLFYKYPNSRFVLQTRATKKWIISKLKHAGWNSKTIIEKDNPEKITHDLWKYKSLLTIKKFIEHKESYEQKVINFFKQNDPSRLIIIDITDKDTQEEEYKRLINYLDLKTIIPNKLPHSNKAGKKDTLASNVMIFIEDMISQTHSTAKMKEILNSTQRKNH